MRADTTAYFPCVFYNQFYGRLTLEMRDNYTLNEMVFMFFFVEKIVLDFICLHELY